MVETIVGLGGAGGLLAGFVYLLVANRHDRRQYQEAIANEVARADAAEQRTRDLRAKLEAALEARYAAEEAAAILRAEAAVRRLGPDGTGGLP